MLWIYKIRLHFYVLMSTLNLMKSGAWRCVSLGSVYVAGRVGVVCVLACVIACGLCEMPGGGQLRRWWSAEVVVSSLALVCGCASESAGMPITFV